MRFRPQDAGSWIFVGALFSLFLAQSPAWAQSGDTSPGFLPIEQEFRVVDKAGRPWVQSRTIGVQIDSEGQQDGDQWIPDPLLVSGFKDVEYPLVDGTYGARFDSRSTGRDARVKILVGAPQDPDRAIPYRLRFYRNGQPVGSETRSFQATREGIAGLPGTLTVPSWVLPNGAEWFLIVVGFVIFMAVVTFGVYRPFYQWRLSARGNVERAVDLSIFLWWLFALVAYAIVLWWKLPYSFPFLLLGCVIAVIMLIRLVLSLRPRVSKNEIYAD